MKRKQLFFTLLSFILLNACQYEKIPAPASLHVPVGSNYLKSVLYKGAVAINSPIWAKADYFAVPLGNLDYSTHNTDTASGVLNAFGTYNGLSSFNNGNSVKLKLKSVYTADYIYILAEWSDSTFNPLNKTWFWNGPKDLLKNDDTSKWTSQKSDDKFIIKFNLPDNSQDIWEWDVALSDPLGYAIDMVGKPDNSVKLDGGVPMFVRNGSGNRGGPLFEFNGTSQIIDKSNGKKATLDAQYYLYNKTNFSGNPEDGHSSYHEICKECHGEGLAVGYAPQLNLPWLNTLSRQSITNFITDPDLHADAYSHVSGLSSETLDNIFAWLRGQSGVPGYYLQTPSGSVADVQAISNVATGKIDLDGYAGYKVLFSRKLNTGNNDDIVFNTKDGNSYTISVSLCNADSVNYTGAVNQKLVFKNSWDEK
jgi:mono/diheme cytochrome c family protein